MIRAFHRLWRLLLPREFRRACGAEMEDVFVASCRAARARGPGRLALRLVAEAIDLTRIGLRLRARSGPIGDAQGGRLVRRTNRGGGWMGIIDDVRYAARSLVRRPSTSVFATITLGLGIGATTAVFGTLESVLLNPVPYPNGDRIVGLYSQVGGGQVFVGSPVAAIEQWATQRDVFEAAEPVTTRRLTLTGAGEPRSIDVAMTDPSFFEMIGREPVIGRLFTDEETTSGASVALLSFEVWSRDFGGSTEALGATLRLEGDARTIIGVLPRGTVLPGWGLARVDVWVPLAAADRERVVQATGVLREGVTLEQANQRLAALDDVPGAAGPGHAMLLSELYGRSVRGHLQLLMVAVVFLLLIACVNVANLMLFRADARRLETAVRTAMGAGSRRLVRQSLIESLALASVGGALGVGIAFVGQGAILALRPSQLASLEHVSMNSTVLAFTTALSVLTGLLFGAAPALHARRAGALEALGGTRTTADRSGRRTRWMLVAGEVALSFALLLGSLTVLSTLTERSRIDVGFAAGEVLVAELMPPRWRYDGDESRSALYDRIQERLGALPEVSSISRSSGAPPRGGVTISQLQIEGGELSEDTKLLYGPYVDSAYFATLGQTLIAGRPFAPADMGGDTRSLILGAETARSLFGGEDAVGGRLRFDEDGAWSTVVGVTADVPMTGLSRGTDILQLYRPLQESWLGMTFLMRVGDDGSAAAGLVREAVADIDAEIRIDLLDSAAALLSETLERERFATTIMAVVASLALLLAAVGLYGVVSQVVGQRTREIGIRIALGAPAASVASLVVASAGRATMVGVGVGVGLSVAGARVLESQVFDLSQTSPSSYVLATLALGLTALLAAYGPVRRATATDPVEAIRAE